MIIKTLCGGYDQNFTYLLENNNEVIIIDCCLKLSEILPHCKNKKIIGAVIMHSHGDHTVDLQNYKKEKITLYGSHKLQFEIDKQLYQDSTIRIGETELKVLETPGHTEDCICLINKKSLFTSDTLFIDGCGRVDLPGGDIEKMWKTLQLIKSLPLDTIIYPGHNYGPTPTSTIKQQLKNNLYLKVSKKDFFRKR